MVKLNIFKYWCVVLGCMLDGCKKWNLEKYFVMEGVDFFLFFICLKNNKIRKWWIFQVYCFCKSKLRYLIFDVYKILISYFVNFNQKINVGYFRF